MTIFLCRRKWPLIWCCFYCRSDKADAILCVLFWGQANSYDKRGILRKNCNIMTPFYTKWQYNTRSSWWFSDDQLFNSRQSAVELPAISCWIADDRLLNCWRSAVQLLTISYWISDDQLLICWRSAGELLTISWWIAADQLLNCWRSAVELLLIR